MFASKLAGFSSFLTRQWYVVILFWLSVAVLLKVLSPSWDSVVQDGDFQFLPADSPSRVGQAMLRKAFPEDRSRSQMVVVFASPSGETPLSDQCTMFDVARRLSLTVGKINLNRWMASNESADPESPTVQRLRHTLDTAIKFDEQWFEIVRLLAGEQSDLARHRLVEAYQYRLRLAEATGDTELAENDRRTVELLRSATQGDAVEFVNIPTAIQDSIAEIWTWEDPVLANNLGSDKKEIKLLSLQLREEFMAVRNVELMEALQKTIDDCRRVSTLASRQLAEQNDAPKRMTIHITGPAAVGADLLGAAKQSVRQSEWYAIIAVVLTLSLIYRSPLLIFLPLFVIGVAFSVSTSALALLASASIPEDRWKLLELYSTTRVFLVVLIFGIGTDLCLFLIVRCREQWFQGFAEKTSWASEISIGWRSVLGAIVGSGLTTTIGLSMMAFSSFAKFRYSGIAISIALLITLAVCITLPAAILACLGPIAYWPRKRKLQDNRLEAANENKEPVALSQKGWAALAGFILARPATVLLVSLGLLIIPAFHGLRNIDHVTYNLVGELSRNATSRQGQELIRKYLPRTETSSITLCVLANQDFDDEGELSRAIEDYRKQLFVDGVHSVQTLTDALGEFPPDRTMSLFSQGAWRRRLLQKHPLTQQKFISNVQEYALKAARFEIVTSDDPFSDAAADILKRVINRTKQISKDSGSKWFESTATVTGTTAGIVDLKRTTQADETIVQFLVTLGVLVVLVILLRRLELSAYLMFSVLFSYLVTLGVCQLTFAFLYGDSFEGVDWKVPLFLFVILVAVGQDYNIYLTMRVLEEQREHGQFEGLRKAIISTGGIITSCGLIMFATFAAMCVGAVQAKFAVQGFGSWPTPSLRGISELGFALSFGVLLDTFVIRTIIVPAYIAWRKLD